MEKPFFFALLEFTHLLIAHFLDSGAIEFTLLNFLQIVRNRLKSGNSYSISMDLPVFVIFFETDVLLHILNRIYDASSN
jgi:hypothetical protein